MCGLLMEMTESEELTAELASYPLLALLQDSIDTFPHVEDISQVKSKIITE